MTEASGPAGRGANGKVLVIGIDGSTLTIIEPMVKDGRIPNMARLINEGSWGVLESTLPPVTIPAWVSMMTGKNPGKLGCFDFLKRVGHGVEPLGNCYGNNAPIWQTLNRYGFRTGVMNLPGTYPPEEVDGFMITGMLTPSKRKPYSYPAVLSAELEQTVHDYEIDVSQWQYFDEGILIKDVYQMTEKRDLAIEYLMEHVPCDFYMLVFTGSDRLQHVLWDKPEIIEAFYEELDGVIGNILKFFGEDTTVFVVSDHGFGPLERTFFVNEWLRRKRLFRIKRKVKDGVFIKIGRFFERLYRFLGERELVKPIVGFLNWIVGFDWLQKFTYAYLSRERLEKRVNWERTKAFSCVHTPHFGHIYINIKGKMEGGCVLEEERRTLQDLIIKELTSLSDPITGERMHVEAYKSENIYVGPHVAEAPDVVFLINEGRCEVDAKVGDGKLFAKGSPFTGWKGTHTKDGVFIAKGPKIKRGYRIEKTSIFDVAPTILHVFGIPEQQDMDGRVLREIFTEDAEFPEPMMAIAPEKELHEPEGLSDDEKIIIEARLRNLGYIS